jgi:hypothetical protein
MLLKVEKYLSKIFRLKFIGPLEQTLDDFIRMIVEQQITVIIMLSFPYDPITSTYAVRELISSCFSLMKFVL